MRNQFIPEDIDLTRNGQKLSCQGKAATTELTELLDFCFDRILGIVRQFSRVVPGFARDLMLVHISATGVVSS